jgi:uncharacterized phosphosugar-binding protein
MVSLNNDISGIQTFLEASLELSKRVINTQKGQLQEVAEHMAQAIADDKRIFVFGTGHSHMMVEEAFYRAGGLAAVTPIFWSPVMLHENAQLSSDLERRSGLASLLLARYEPQAGEMLFVFSNSGVNQMPVEMVLRGKEQGLTVVAVCSLRYSQIAPLSPLGKRLDQVADFTIDNGGEPGDALVQIEGLPWRLGASSTIIGALIWNCLLVDCVERLTSSGVEPPVFASLNMPGAKEHNQALLNKWRGTNPHL